MLKYILKKFIAFFISLFLIITLTFFLLKSIPGNPFIGDGEITKETLDILYNYYGLDQPLFIQYLKYLKNFLFFDFGESFVYFGQKVSDIIINNFPISLFLSLEALFIAIPFGIFFGCLAALNKNSWKDFGLMVLAIVGISVPNFLFATLLQYFLAIKLKIFPVARIETFAHTILPAISLSVLPMAFIARLIRNNLIEVLEQDYIKTAYAKGLSKFSVIIKHGLRNAFLPVLAYLGPLITHTITGSFVIEKIFGISGIGQWLILGIKERDYSVVMGLIVFFSSFLMLIMFISDILYSILDPRIRKNYEKS